MTPISGYKFANCYSNRLQQLFWHVVLNFCLMVIIAIGLRFWYQFENNSILPVFGILDQGLKLPYPAVYLCLGYLLNPRSLAKYRTKFLKPNLTMSFPEIDNTLQSMLRFQRSRHNISYRLEELLLYNIDIDRFQENVYKFHYEVKDLLKECYFQGVRYECEDVFIASNLAPGHCFVFNSIYNKSNFHDQPQKMMFKKFSKFDEDWTLRFKILNRIQTELLIYLKDPLSILSLTDYPNYVWHSKKDITKFGFTIEDHYSEKNIRSLSLSRRKCLFSDESFLDKNLQAEFKTNFYNQDICLNYCHALKFLENCKCLPTFAKDLFPKLASKSKICTIENMECFENSYLMVRRQDCKECYDNCNYTVYISKPEIQRPRKLKITKYHSSLKPNYLELSFDLVYWPKIQIRVINIFSSTEFLVALASTASLFLGTSAITFFEAFYNLFIRYPFSYFVNRDYIEKVNKKREELEKLKPIPCINMSLKPGFKEQYE